MDSVDFLSDSSESSLKTEPASSNASSVSNLSGYQTEFLELKQLIDAKTAVKSYKSSEIDSKRNTIISFYENRLQNLNVQLQDSLKQNEKLKNVIYSLENKRDISSSEKIGNLLKKNNQLESNLEAANNQIKRLVSVPNNKKSAQNDLTLLQDKILHLEKCNHDLHLQNFSLTNELSQCNLEKGNLELEQKNLKSEVNELTLELAAKAKCVNELKVKIAEQHVQIQAALQKKAELSYSLDSLSSELQHVIKSENWYKNKLHQLQEEKNCLTATILKNSKIITSQDKTLEHLKLELNKWKCTCDEVRLTSLKEKENLLKQLASANSKANETESKDGINDSHLGNDLERLTGYYEMTIQELNNDVSRLKDNFEKQQNAMENLSRENSDLLEKYLLLQSSLKEKEYELEKLEHTRKDLKLKLEVAVDKEQEHNTNLLQLKKQCSDLEIELSMNKREKDNIVESVTVIKEQFKTFKSRYDALKDELRTKNQEILQLQFVNTNLKTLEEEKINCITQKEIELKLENCRLKKEIERIDQENVEIKKKIDELESEHQEHILLQSKLEELTASMEDKERVISNLENRRVLKDNITIFELKKNELKENRTCENNNVAASFSDFVENNYITIGLNDINNIGKILEYICKLCQGDSDSDATLNLLGNIDSYQREYIKVLLTNVDSHFRKVNTELKNKEEALIHMKKKSFRMKHCLSKLQTLERKWKMLHDKTEENTRLLKIFDDVNNTNNWDSNMHQVKHLQTLLEVKTREQKDKQKKYERNYRTLLRKVKEHMKGRNLAEKHNLHLQEMYNNLSDEFNTLRLQFDSKNSEILGLQNCIDKNVKNNELLRSEIAELQKKISVSDNCENCFQLAELNKKLEESLNSSENRYSLILNEINLKNELIDHQQKKNHELSFNLSVVHTDYNNSVSKVETLIEENKKLCANLNNLENILTEEKFLKESLEAKLLEEKQKFRDIYTQKQQLKKEVDSASDKNSCLLKEIENLNLRLQLKAEELNELQLQKEELNHSYLTKDTNLQNIIIALKSQLQMYKNEIDTTKHEKFFLQRLVNDLKVALQVHVNHNKVLKEYLNNMCKESKEECSSLSVVISQFPSPSKFDDCYINKLLQENKAPLEDKPFSDIQVCLDALRNEITVLQKQIIEKNVPT